jgi:hypothetical protein
MSIDSAIIDETAHRSPPASVWDLCTSDLVRNRAIELRNRISASGKIVNLRYTDFGWNPFEVDKFAIRLEHSGVLYEIPVKTLSYS